MSKLSPLRRRLGDLARRRWLLRTGAALAGLLLALAWTTCGMLLLDWQFEFDKPQRVVLLLLGVAAVAWAWRRYGRPLMGPVEGELEMALLVERQQRIDSDLVAALQFDNPAASSWGSPQLETAVIDYVADFGRELDVGEGLPAGPLRRRGVLLAASLCLMLISMAAAPGHWSAFINRMLLGSRHYPTSTLIQRIVVNEHSLPVDALDSASVRSAYWEPVRFEVHCSGDLPPQGSARLRTVASQSETEIVLQADAHQPGVYIGQLDRLVDSIDYQLFLGDAWTDAARLTVIPLPVVELSLEVTPPEYAAGDEAAASTPDGSRQIAVIEGSNVGVRITSDKPLETAELVLDGRRYPLTREASKSASAASADRSESWRLPTTGSPFARITEPMRYEVDVVDQDGLRLRDPLEGFVRIKADRAPRVSATMVTRHVLPTAQPTVDYSASDDFGLASLRLHRQVVRQQSEQSDMAEDTIEVPLADRFAKSLRGALPIDLSSLGLVKGDQLKLTFEATDHRGSLPGKSTLSEPLVLEVTDERGVLAAMVEADEQSARQLDAIIQRQLGIGDSP